MIWSILSFLKYSTDNFYVDYHLGIDDTHMRMFVPTGKGRTVYQLNSLFNHRYYEPSLRTLPVPALLIRQKSEAWDHPFIAVYEPYGNGAKSQIRSVYTQMIVYIKVVRILAATQCSEIRISFTGQRIQGRGRWGRPLP